jgi:colanic acid biosynthesis glycosyl transferase WcaI
MKALLISQVFYPDTTAVSQVLTDLAEDLIVKGHEVAVITSRRGYENPSSFFVHDEVYHGVKILRLWQTAFRKHSRLGRIMNSASFNIAVAWRLLITSRSKHDIIIGTTVPPFLSCVGLIVAKMKRLRFCFYGMDLQPELAIISGYLSKKNPVVKLSLVLSEFIYRQADLIIVLDRFMAGHIVNRGAQPERVRIIPIWPAMAKVYKGDRLSNPFRRKMGFGDKIVVMYSGNMAIVHPLDTLLMAAAALKDDGQFLFVFIGGGVRKQDVVEFKTKHNLMNISLLPLQPRNRIHISLGSADLQVVIHGVGCTGYTHPNKVYGAMYIGKPVLYIGPKPSHISEILNELPSNISVRHGEVERLVAELRHFAYLGEQEWQRIGKINQEYAQKRFSRSRLSGRLIQELEKSLC